MKGDKQRRCALHIRTLPEQPDAFLVVMDDSEPGAVPVIPTAMAESYWAHPPRVDTPAHPAEHSTDRPHAFLVVMDDSEPGAVPVIPTAMAESYWAHPPRVDTPAHPAEHSTDRPHANSAGGVSRGDRRAQGSDRR